MAYNDMVYSWDWNNENADGLAAYHKVIADIANKKVVKDVQAMGIRAQFGIDEKDVIHVDYTSDKQFSAALGITAGDTGDTAVVVDKTTGRAHNRRRAPLPLRAGRQHLQGIVQAYTRRGEVAPRPCRHE
jgi:hypothetical protein